MQNNLTSLAGVTAWLGIKTPDDNALLTRLIGSASRAIHTHLQRPTLFQHAFNEVYDGAGRGRQVLRNWPVLSVGSLTVGTTTITPSASYGQSGFSLEPWDGYPPGRPQALNLSGYAFCAGQANVAVTYTAGYVTKNEPQAVPIAAPFAAVATAPCGTWGADQGVAYTSTGIALTPVTGIPSTGQYSVLSGKYTFAAADAGMSVLLSYSFIPGDVEQACVEMVGERYRTKDRIGENSKTLGGQQTVSYSTAAMNDFVKSLLQPFRRVILC